MAKQSNNSLRELRSFLRGQIHEFTVDRARILKEKEDIQLKVMELMDDLNKTFNEVETKCTAKIAEIDASVKLHEDMLLHLNDDIKTAVNKDVYAKIKNIDSILTVVRSEVNGMFTLKKQPLPVIIKSTTRVVERPEKPDLAKVSKELFVDYNEADTKEYIRKNGKVNNRIIADGVLKYLAQIGREATANEVIGYIDKVYPRAKDSWADTRKGLYNMIQNHLKFENGFEQIGNGVYRLRRENKDNG